ncbi:MAG: tRNA (adenosine(37)-N6)-dimethylallyltransferase MiaA [Thermosynechococcaceae cyanobacterium]
MEPGLIVICGPTATGKSALALQIASRLKAPIVSADSRQVYQGFDIGTAKPTIRDRAQVPHYLIDICPPTTHYTVAEYQRAAQTLIQDVQEQGAVPLLVGGTGLYIQSVVEGLKIPRVAPQPQLRSQLETISQSERYQWLRQVDEDSSQKIHAHDQVRTLRALEVYYTTGIPLSAQQGRQPPAYPILRIGLDIADLVCHTEMIQQRTQSMLKQGWLAEVSHLLETHGLDLPLLQTLGYSELNAYLAGVLSLEESVAQIVLHTRQFAKRQRTWFRSDPTIQWFDAASPQLFAQVWNCVELFLNRSL